MNNQKRTINPLLGRQFRHEQPEDITLKYQCNWGCAQQQDITASTWTVENGGAVLSGEAFTASPGLSSVLVTGAVGENTILNTVTFADGQTDSRILKLKITDNYAPNIDYDYGI